MSILNIESFVADEVQPSDESYKKYGWLRGTIEATVQGETRRVPATKFKENEITAGAFVVKYKTGTKVWLSSVSTRQYHDGKIGESVSGGFDSRSGKHHLLNSIWFRDDVKNSNNISKR